MCSQLRSLCEYKNLSQYPEDTLVLNVFVFMRHICWASGLLWSISSVWCAFCGRDGWACAAAVKWGYSASVFLKGRWCVSVHPGIESTLIDDRAVRLEYQACKWSCHYCSALSLKWNTHSHSLHHSFSSLFSLFPSANCLFLSPAVKDDHNQEFGRHCHGPHRDLCPTD